MDKSTIRTKARRRLDENVASFWSDAELDDYINEGYLYYWQWMINARHPGAMKNTPLNITGGTATIALPADFCMARLVERVVTSGTYPLWYQERVDDPNYTAGVPSNTDLYMPKVRFEGANLVIEPTPSDTVTGGIKLTYYFYPDRMTTDTGATGTPNAAIHDFFHDLLVYQCVLLAKAKEEHLDSGSSDLGAWGVLMREKEQAFKSTIETPTTQRQYVQPFIIGDYYG